MQFFPVTSLRSLSFLTRLFAISAATVAALAAPITMTEIIPPTGMTIETVQALNAQGQIALQLKDPSQNQPTGLNKLAVWQEAQGFTLLPDSEIIDRQTRFLTDSGILLGYGPTANSWDQSFFVWSPSLGFQQLQPAGYRIFFATGVTDSGLVAGTAYNADMKPVALVWNSASGFQDIGTLGGGADEAIGVSAQGIVAGKSGLADGSPGAFVWDATTGIHDISAGSFPLFSFTMGRDGSILWYGQDRVTFSALFGAWDPVRGPRTLALPPGFSVFQPAIDAPAPGGSLFVGWDLFGSAFVVDVDSGAITALPTRNRCTPANAQNRFAGMDSSGSMFIWDRVNGMTPVPRPDGVAQANPRFMNNNGLVFGEMLLDTQITVPFVWNEVDGFQQLTVSGAIGASVRFSTEPLAVIAYSYDDGSTHYFTVKVPAPALGKPDLQITGFTITPDPKKTKASNKGKGKGKGSEKECDDDDSKNAKTATVQVFVANKGNGNAAASSTKIVDGRKLLTTLATPAIPAGQSVTLAYTWDLKKVEEGKHTLTATADSAAEVTEADESNNTFKTTFTIKED